MKRLARALVNTVSWFFATLGHRRCIALGHALGSFVFYVVPIRRKVVLNNLARSFPEKSAAERWQIARACYRRLGRLFTETMAMPRFSAEEIAGMSRWHNVEVLTNAFAEEKGLIFCMSHMGNWELIGFEGARRGYQFYAITKVLKGALNEAIMASRKKNFQELPPSGSFDRGVEVIRKKLALALIIDQHRSSNRAVNINFFGRPAATSPAPALFAMRTGAPVIAGWMSVGADGVYDLWFRGPFPLPEAATEAEMIQRHTELLHADLESFIREHPSDWYWVHRRWKVDESQSRPATAALGEVS